MSFDPTFTYALDHFDGLMGTFFPTVWRLARVMALLGIAWSGVQIAFGTMEVRKGAVGLVMRFALFFLVIWFYPAFCRGVRTFAMGLGHEGGKETANEVLTSVDNYIKGLEDETAVLQKIHDSKGKNGKLTGNPDDEACKSAEALIKAVYSKEPLIKRKQFAREPRNAVR